MSYNNQGISIIDPVSGSLKYTGLLYQSLSLIEDPPTHALLYPLPPSGSIRDFTVSEI